MPISSELRRAESRPRDLVLGIVGSFVGGFLQNLFEYHTLSVHSFHTVGLIGSIIGAWVLLLLLRLTRLEPGRRRY